MGTLKIIFWISLLIVFYTYFGYGILLYILVRIKKIFSSPNVRRLPDELPHVTLFIAAYNEEKVIKEKMENSYSLNYPKEKLHILWVTDGSTDKTNELLSEYKDVTICFDPARKGKTAALNRGMQHVNASIVVFTDANTVLNEECITEIVKCFEDSGVGCVAGEKRIFVADKDNASSGGEGFYWKYESKLKEWDSILYSACGAAGELFAIRREYYKVMPDDTLLDDFVLSLDIVADGHKIEYCKDAFACEYGSADLENEEKRKVRIAAGGLQSVWRLRKLLNPLKYGIFSFQYISHRVLRWTLTPILFFAVLPINGLLSIYDTNPVYKVLFMLQILFYLMALAGMLLEKREIKMKILFIPCYFVFMNSNVLKGVPYLIRNKGKGAWEKSVRA